jgi:hypothetical protein
VVSSIMFCLPLITVYFTTEPQRAQSYYLLFCFSLRRRKAKWSNPLVSCLLIKPRYSTYYCSLPFKWQCPLRIGS